MTSDADANPRSCTRLRSTSRLSSWRCWRATRRVRFEPADYAELLGLYLGDGYICVLPRTERLRIFLDARHSEIVDDTEALLHRCFPENRLSRFSPHGKQMVVVSLYNAHLSCILPQHGPGKKHDRRITLEPWQDAQIRAAHGRSSRDASVPTAASL